MNKKKKILIIIIILFVLIIFSVFKFSRYMFLQEDIIFFQFLNSIIKSNKENNDTFISDNQSEKNQTKSQSFYDTYIIKEDKESNNDNIQSIEFDVEYQNTKLKDVNLAQTIHNQTLVYEKIAPGTSGSFDIVLKTKQDVRYQLDFKSENEKPSNLQFYTIEEGKRYQTLEELGKTLQGILHENETKIIQVQWEWCYEINQENNKQDTEDAKKLREYNFTIYVQGKD